MSRIARTIVPLTGALAIGCMGPLGAHESGVEQTNDPAPVCEATSTTIYAGQTTDSGTATVSSDGSDLIVSLAGANGWQITEYHIYAGTDPVPTTNSGAPSPGQFPYKDELDEPVGSIEVRIPLEDIGAACDDELNIAVHTVMVKIEGGVVVDTQTGWGEGPNEFRRGWGWWFSTEICCEAPGCVRSKGPWREIPGLWDLDGLVLGGADYDAAALVSLLYTLPEDASIYLAHQYVAAKLNEASGAYVDAQTAADMAAAEAWMDANVDGDGLLSYGITGGHAAYAGGLAIGQSLWSYNNGQRATPSCDPEWLAPVPLP